MRVTKATHPAAPAFRGEIDRLFDRFLGGGMLTPMEPLLDPTLWRPALDFAETPTEFTVRVDVAGIPKENLDVDLDGQLLTITGHREFAKEAKEEAFFVREREEGKFIRTIRLPAAVEPGTIAAAMDNGVLSIRLPKAVVAKPNRIAIK